MKKLIIVVIILFLMICTGCPMGYDPPAEPRATITSQDLFVCEGVSCIYAEVRYPVTIYNPNNYTITVTIENCLAREISVKISKPQVPSEWKTIPPLSSITITEDTP